MLNIRRLTSLYVLPWIESNFSEDLLRIDLRSWHSFEIIQKRLIKLIWYGKWIAQFKNLASVRKKWMASFVWDELFTNIKGIVFYVIMFSHILPMKLLRSPLLHRLMPVDLTSNFFSFCFVDLIDLIILNIILQKNAMHCFMSQYVG